MTAHTAKMLVAIISTAAVHRNGLPSRTCL